MEEGKSKDAIADITKKVGRQNVRIGLGKLAIPPNRIYVTPQPTRPGNGARFLGTRSGVRAPMRPQPIRPTLSFSRFPMVRYFHFRITVITAFLRAAAV